MRMRSKLNAPPGAFQFIDAPISHEPLIEWGFDYLVAQVIQRRKANPRFNLSLDPLAVGIEVETQNAARVSRIAGAESYVTEGGIDAPPNFPLAHRNVPLSVAAKSRAIKAGVGVLTDWLGSGATPVEHSLASQRASKCVTCPGNDKGGLDRFFTVPASEMIRKQIEMAKDMSLTTPYDSQLQVCSACLCPLRTKVFVPIEHIKAHLTDDVKVKLSEKNTACWILEEIK